MRNPRVGETRRLTRSAAAASERLTRSAAAAWPLPSRAGHLFDYPSSIIGACGHRDSDVSSPCSSRRSSACGCSSYTTASAAPSYRVSCLRAINSYLSSLSPPVYLKVPLPPAREIANALRLLLSHLDFDHPLRDLNRDLPPLLASLRCPFKLSKSALKAPSTPHAWPSVLAVLHWLVQLARAADHLASTPSFAKSSCDGDVHGYIARSYSLFLSGDDCSVEDLDAEYLDRIEQHAKSAAEAVEAIEAEVFQVESKLQEVATAPSRLESLKLERVALLEDIKKFQAMVDTCSSMIVEKRQELAERERKLELKDLERRKLDEENQVMRQRIRGQGLSSREVERMMRELQAVERDIAVGESRRNEMDEKAWKLNSEVEGKFREIEALTEQCNQAIRKLKLRNHFQYVLNNNGSSAAEVIGFDYKDKLKPAINALAEEAKSSIFAHAQEGINLQKQLHDNDMLIEGKRVHCANLQAKIDEAGARVDLLKKEMTDHASRCATEAEKTKEDLAIKE